jgi:outer membrane immunogenic protein
MKKLLFGTVAIAALACGAANAAELPVYKAPPPVAPQWTWTGWYAGAAGGYSWGSATIHHGSGDIFFPGQEFDISNPTLKGGIFGLEWGYNWQFGTWVVGYESDFSLTTERGSANENPPFGDPGFHNEIKEQWLSTWRGRLGWAAGSWLVYATGGAAVAHVENDDISPVFHDGGRIGTCLAPGTVSACSIAENHYHWGWTAGGGVEWMVTPGVSVKAEYLFVDLQEKSYFNPAPVVGSSAPGIFFSDQRVRLTDNIVRVGLNVHFDPFFPQSAVFPNR